MPTPSPSKDPVREKKRSKKPETVQVIQPVKETTGFMRKWERFTVEILEPFGDTMAQLLMVTSVLKMAYYLTWYIKNLRKS